MLAAMGLVAASLLLTVPTERSGVTMVMRRLEECEAGEDPENAPIFADATVAVVISLIILTIIFEKLHDVLEEKAKETMHGLEGVVDALMGELTVLGALLPSLEQYCRPHCLEVLRAAAVWHPLYHHVLNFGRFTHARGRFHRAGVLRHCKGRGCEALKQAHFCSHHRVCRGMEGTCSLRRG